MEFLSGRQVPRKGKGLSLIHICNVSIEGLTEYIELYNQGSRETYEARKAILVRERDRLKERMSAMQEALAYLNRKIATYDRWSK